MDEIAVARRLNWSSNNQGRRTQAMYHWPADLTRAVLSALDGHPGRPSEKAIHRLFEVMYFSSLRTEEGEHIVFHVVYLDPSDPDPRPPRRIVQDRWRCVPLAERLPFNVPAMTKIARASDPRSSSFAVFHDEHHELFVWGLIDQGNSYYDFVNYNADSGPERPGLFQASITGVAHITAYRGYQLIADLRASELLPPALDTLGRGPLHDSLLPAIQSFLNAVRGEVGAEVYDRRLHWDRSLADGWLSSLRRLLLRIQQHHHGGAILIAPDTNDNDLNIKYAIHYDRLRMSLYRNAISQIEYTNASDEIFEQYLTPGRTEIFASLYLNETVAADDLEHGRKELDAALWFISLLSRVDGLVLLSPDLEVRGFGVEIQTREQPKVLVRAADERATKRNRVPEDYNRFGTRHRSMMRYCAKVPYSAGFVVSQDGDVRAMTQQADALVLWENIKLRLDDFERRKPKSNALRVPLP